MSAIAVLVVLWIGDRVGLVDVAPAQYATFPIAFGVIGFIASWSKRRRAG